MMEVVRRYTEWKQNITKNLNISIISRKELLEKNHLPILNFTIESDQIESLQGFKKHLNL